jgi:phage repressor protein C with HTH and peptisase S24 domain
MLAAVAASVRAGRSVRFKARGKSMEPRVKDGAIVTVSPLGAPPKKGDVVLARVNGRWLFHLVSAVRGGQVQISNNHGHVNGWTALSNVVGKLDEKGEHNENRS